MAKQEYSKEEILEFQKKEARIIAENALSHATQIVMGLGASGLDQFTLENIKKRVKETAADLFLWVYGQGELAVEYNKTPNISTKSKLEKDTTTSEPPIPQLEQKKILDIIAKSLGVNESDIRPCVNRWALEVSKGKVQYPAKEVSVNEFIKWYQSERLLNE